MTEYLETNLTRFCPFFQCVHSVNNITVCQLNKIDETQRLLLFFACRGTQGGEISYGKLRDVRWKI